MSGLLIALSPGEKFIVNGALLENGDKHARIRIKDNDVRVLRCADALHPKDVNSPVKRFYYAIQLLITGDLKEEDILSALYFECDALGHVFEKINPKLMPAVRTMIEKKRFYSALCSLKQLIVVEAGLLSLGNNPKDSMSKVA